LAKLVERTKRFRIKVGEDREVTARFATLGVKDLDGDIIESGAIGEQSVFLGAWNHNPSTLPPGMGKTYEEDGAALFKGDFLETPSGNDLYTTLKAADELDPELMEWSFRFFVEDGGYEVRDEDEVFSIKKARVTHVAPVETGAGIDTGTVAIKCHGCEGGEKDKADAPVFDYEKLATTIATAVVTALEGQKSGGCKGECGGGCGDGKQKGDTLGTLIRSLRDEKDLTNDDLAEAAGISIETIGQIIGGTLTCPKASRLESLAQKLEVPLSELVKAAETDGCGTYETSADDQGDAKAQADAADAAADDADDAGGTKNQAAAADAGATDADANPQDDAGQKDADADADQKDNGNDTEPDLEAQVAALLNGFEGLPPGVDPGAVAYGRFSDQVLAN
jgi:transcriptional regulator with XRE-family HTH domain